MAIIERDMMTQQPQHETGPIERREPQGQVVNVGDNERVVTSLVGTGLALYGLTQRDTKGLLLAALGGALVYRGMSGHCPAYSALNINTAGGSGERGSVSKVEHAVTINRSAEEIYRFWRNFENLPQFMNHLESVRVLDEKRSHWQAKAPLGTSVAWDAEIFLEKPNELIAWRSLEGADVFNAGTVRFTPAPNGRGTEVKVTISYQPPAGKLGAAVAYLTGEEPSIQVADDLRRFKQIMEAGSITTVDGQPAGRK